MRGDFCPIDATFLDASILRVLISVLEQLERTGGKLASSASSRRLVSPFELTRLDRLFHLTETRAAALAYLKLSP